MRLVSSNSGRCMVGCSKIWTSCCRATAWCMTLWLASSAPQYSPYKSGSRFESPIVLWISGTECCAFSSMGKRAKAAHSNFETFLVWVCTIKKHKPGIAIHEITGLHPEATLEFFFSSECAGAERRGGGGNRHLVCSGVCVYEACSDV